MRKPFLIALFGVLPFYLAAGPALQQHSRASLPTPADYPAADPQCKHRQRLVVKVTGRAVDFPKTVECELLIHRTCATEQKQFSSGVRASKANVCGDYYAAAAALRNREICCDDKSAEPPGGPNVKCDQPAPWSDTSSNCNDPKSPQLTISGATATLSMCGFPVFSYRNSNFNDRLFADAYRSAMTDHLRASGYATVCCDKLNAAVRSGNPCDPRTDVDCDGRPNRSDIADEFPAFDNFTRTANTRIDPFPSFVDASDPDFLPGRTARAAKGVGDCPCKWVLVGGEKKCSPDGKQDHYYKATWRCPKTGAEVFTTKYAPATTSCEQ